MPSPMTRTKRKKRKSLRMGMILKTMTKRKKTKKKKKFEPLFAFFRHRLSPFGRLTSVRLTIAFVGLVCLAGAACSFEPAARAQDPSGSRTRVFVVFTTVFNDQ